MTTLIAAARREERDGSPLRSLIKLVALVCLASAPHADAPAFGQTSPAADDPYLQTVWTTEDGLPQNSVNAILQTRDGYLWLATFGGLARFDGVKFTIFNSGNTPGLKSNRILSLCEARDGTLWLGTETGEVMSLKDGVGHTYTAADGLPGDHVLALKEDRGGTLWAATEKGLARFRDGRFVTYTTRDGMPHDRVWAIHEDQNGQLFIITEAGLVRFEGERFTTFKPPGGLKSDSWVASAERRGGGLWIGTRDGAVTSFGGRGFESHPHPAGTPDTTTRFMLQTREGTLWVSYFLPNSVYRFKDGVFSLYRIKSLQGIIRTMFEDREGNLWMGSDGSGLIRLKRRKVTTYTTDDGLPSNNGVRAITDDGQGGLWIATNAGLVRRQAGRFTTYTERDGLLSDDLSALCRDRAGALWIGSDHGLTRFKDNQFTNYTTAQGLSNSNVYSVAEDREGALWVGTGAGLNRLRDGKFTIYTRADGLVHGDVRFIMQTRDGALWLGTTGGLSRFRDGAFTGYTVKDGLSNDYVRAVHEEPDGTLWIGTYGGGLNRLKDGRITNVVTTKDGLFDDFISRILEDDGGNLWMLGNRGIFRVSRQALHDFAAGRTNSILSVSYGIADGMRSSEGNGGFQSAGLMAADGKMWFPTINGVVMIEPHEMNNLPPPVVIEQVMIERAAHAADRAVRVKPGQGDLEIYYTGLSFSRPEQVKFKYQMVGLDHNWVEAGTRRTAYYPHLPPGEYAFRVIAENGDGVWNTEGRSLSVIVLPPFYRTWWFVTLLSLGVAGLALLAYLYRVRRLQRAHAAQQTFARQLIASQEGERKRIAAELHDSLGQHLVIIKNLALMLMQPPAGGEDAKQHIEEISAEASQAISEVKEISYNLRPYQLDRIGLTKAVEAVVKKAAAAGGITFTADLDVIDDALPPDSQINFYRIVQESINNVIKHSGATEAELVIRREPTLLRLTIHDNGRGFVPADAAARAFDGGKGGFGLLGISERAQLLGGSAVVQSAAGQGTIVEVKIGLGGNHRER